jgi:hypothetical protein
MPAASVTDLSVYRKQKESANPQTQDPRELTDIGDPHLETVGRTVTAAAFPGNQAYDLWQMLWETRQGSAGPRSDATGANEVYGVAGARTADTLKSGVSPTEGLYADYSGSSSKLGISIALLGSARQYLQDALTNAHDGDLVAADERVTQFESTLLELFMLRSISVGFELRVAALIAVFKNRGGAPFEADQLYALKRFVEELLAQPALGEEEAFMETRKLEVAGMRTTFAELGALADIIPDDAAPR